VADAVAMARTRPACARIALRVDVPDIAVRADRAHLTRTLFNLILNGAQAMSAAGEISIRASVTGDRWQVEVADQGPGLSSEARARLFEPFFSTKSQGVGLGLAFAKRVVLLQGGTIELRCPPGGGTTAVLNLPIEPGLVNGGSVAS
jgi:signal transduction histidine kinase